jgi:hypothetical protein
MIGNVIILIILIETCDMIIAHPGYALGSSKMGEDIEPDWRETHPGNGASASTSGEFVTPRGDGRLEHAKHGVQEMRQNDHSSDRKEYAIEN